MLDFRIETFLTVCQTMNFTVAAKQLNITQPAVSQHIHFLEEEYDTALFIYKNKRLSLTNSGALLRKRLLTMKNDEKAIKEELKSNYHGIETLSIGVTMTIGEYAIVDKLSDFLNRHPKKIFIFIMAIPRSFYTCSTTVRLILPLLKVTIQKKIIHIKNTAQRII